MQIQTPEQPTLVATTPQIGMLLGATYGLLAPEVLPSLNGRVVLFAVPAEEYIRNRVQR